MATREDHLDWCKQRALELLDRGDLKSAEASMLSDLGKHSETANSQPVAAMLMTTMDLSKKDEVRKFIVGFN